MPADDFYRQAVVSMPSSAQLGGADPLPFVRFPFFPTSPWYSTNPNVGYQVRYYSTGIDSSNADFAVGVESLRPIQFDMPCRVIAFNGACCDDSSAVRFSEDNMNLAYLVRFEGPAGDRITLLPRLASTVVGNARQPGEIGGHGYNVDVGTTIFVGITPLFDPLDEGVLRIDIVLHVLEMRGPRNFTVGR